MTRQIENTTVARPQAIAVLGSTGSIGTSCLDVIREHSASLRAAGLVAHRSLERLCQQVSEFQPD
ncbi:MAG: hypothetical protein ACK58L_03130, partial [Planctomycetota bacterium]